MVRLKYVAQKTLRSVRGHIGADDLCRLDDVMTSIYFDSNCEVATHKSFDSHPTVHVDFKNGENYVLQAVLRTFCPLKYDSLILRNFVCIFFSNFLSNIL